MRIWHAVRCGMRATATAAHRGLLQGLPLLLHAAPCARAAHPQHLVGAAALQLEECIKAARAASPAWVFGGGARRVRSSTISCCPPAAGCCWPCRHAQHRRTGSCCHDPLACWPAPSAVFCPGSTQTPLAAPHLRQWRVARQHVPAASAGSVASIAAPALAGAACCCKCCVAAQLQLQLPLHACQLHACQLLCWPKRCCCCTLARTRLLAERVEHSPAAARPCCRDVPGKLVVLEALQAGQVLWQRGRRRTA